MQPGAVFGMLYSVMSFLCTLDALAPALHLQLPGSVPVEVAAGQSLPLSSQDAEVAEAQVLLALPPTTLDPGSAAAACGASPGQQQQEQQQEQLVLLLSQPFSLGGSSVNSGSVSSNLADNSSSSVHLLLTYQPPTAAPAQR